MEKLTREQEQELLHRCLGDCANCDQLILQYQKLVARAVRKAFFSKNFSFEEDDVEEVTNEAWLNIFDDHCRKLRQYRTDKGKGLAGWIYMIACQTALIYIREKRYQMHPISFEQDDRDLLKEMMRLSEKIGVRIEKRVQLDTIRKFMEKELTPQERLVSVPYFFNGLSYQEVAEMCSKKASLVYPLICKARKKTEEYLRETGWI